MDFDLGIDMGSLIALGVAIVGPALAFFASNTLIKSRVEEHREQIKTLTAETKEMEMKMVAICKDITRAVDDINRIGGNLRAFEDKVMAKINGIARDCRPAGR